MSVQKHDDVVSNSPDSHQDGPLCAVGKCYACDQYRADYKLCVAAARAPCGWHPDKPAPLPTNVTSVGWIGGKKVYYGPKGIVPKDQVQWS